MSTFKLAYERLNELQRQAVDTIEGPVMVLAGPGTGKTQVLAARIASILQKTDTDPNSILALTFTDSAAKNMQERLVAMIGSAGYYVQITTFHAFCSDCIRQFPEFFPVTKVSENVSDLERFAILEEVLQNSEVQLLKPLHNNFHYVSQLLSAISNLKREGVLPEQAVAMVEEEWKEFEATKDELTKLQAKKTETNLTKKKEVAVIYAAYEAKMRAVSKYDYDDMILFVLEAFKKHEELLQEYQEKLQYFLIDEYQDTNSAQNNIVDQLASFWAESANIFVVGDPNQAIYRFQGASIENVWGFVQRYPSAEVITLTAGYRCPQDVYTLASASIEHNTLTAQHEVFEKSRKSLVALKNSVKGECSVVISTADSQTLELVGVGQDIKQLIEQGVPAEEIAVLYHKNSEAVELLELFAAMNIQVEIDGSADVLKSEVVTQFFNLLKLIEQAKTSISDELLFTVLTYEWIGVPSTTVFKLSRLAYQTKQSFSALILSENLPENTPLFLHITDEEKEVIRSVLQKIDSWIVTDANSVFVETFEKILTESGFLPWVLEHTQRSILIQQVNAVYREVKLFVAQNHEQKLSEWIAAVATMQEHGIAIISEDLNASNHAVRLSTVHKAKGREWEHVFIIHCQDKRWGNTRTPNALPLPNDLILTDVSKKEKNEDERRLFYVALTRAKSQVHISVPKTEIQGNRSKEVLGSMFIQELKEAHPELLAEREYSFTPDQADIVSAATLHQDVVTAKKFSESDTKFFQNLLESFSLSVTALNSYLKDPKEFLFNHLLRVPRTKADHLAFGTAIHSTLEFAARESIEKKQMVDTSVALAVFGKSLQKELLTQTQLERWMQKGAELLPQYLLHLQQSNFEPVRAEYQFGYGFSTTMIDDIKLNGRIDRIDLIDGDAKTVRVVDYKTGRAKSIGEIEASIKSVSLSEREMALPAEIRGAYKRQLVFYSLLAELDNRFPYRVAESVFSFVEPTDSGKFVDRRFTVTTEEVVLLKELIKTVMAEIRSLAFLDFE